MELAPITNSSNLKTMKKQKKVYEYANGFAMSNYIEYNLQYAKGLDSYGFNYTNIIRIDNNKISSKKIDFYMNNLIKRPDIDIIFACVEPDIDKLTSAIDPFTNHVHFAWKGKDLSRGVLANSMRAQRRFLRSNQTISGMAYFTKHLGKSLSYHNIYV